MNIRFLKQVILQIAGLNYAALKYRNKIINSIDDFVPQTRYSLPFAGEWFTVNGGVTPETSHSWEILPQRFAYDFNIVDDEGRSWCGDNMDIHSYYCYGKDVLAPADGVIVSIKNNFPDCRIMSDGQTDPDTPDIGGNRITIKHSSSEYSVICHLMPGSVKVKKGQVVKRGAAIAKCGNSGNTTEPHIHFQVQNTAHFYAGIGKPVCFHNIHKKIYAQENTVAPDTMSEKEDINDEYLHKGILVKNCENESGVV